MIKKNLNTKNYVRRAGFAGLGAIALAMASMPTFVSAETITGLSPAKIQPTAETLKPGLAVQYYGAIFNSIRELVGWMDYKDGWPGDPIPMLNYQVGFGNVLTTTTDDMVGADIRGLIHFEKSGNYTVMVQANDGVRLNIGGKMIYEDPDVHADRFSDEITLEILEPGWYPVRVLYFEKRNSSTLELYWDPPGPEEIDYVPAEAFAHIGK